MKLKKKLVLCLAAITAGVLILGGCSGESGLPQYGREIEKGEKIAVMTVKDYGTIKIRFFEKEAPKAVENFIGLAEKGYYDGVTFHRVINDFMIQGGDPEGTGMGGESIWGEGFGVEANDNLRHFRGALSMAHSAQPNSNGSQFFIVQNPTVTEQEFEYYESAGMEFPDDVKEKYLEEGGYPSLDGDYSVFGQVFEGMDVVDRIAAVNTDGNDKPMEDVVIETVKIVEYEG